MHLTTQQVLALTEDTVRKFLSLAIPEGLYLDYKEGLSGTSEKDAKREFLKDVTAFANAAGGHLFLGVKEPSEGISVDGQLIGLDDGEALAQDLERLASTSVDPRIPGLRIVRVPLANGKSCLTVHIPPSLSRPHMVNYAGHRSFYVRHSESSFPMTTHEVREAVLTSSSAEARARHYVEQRLLEVCESLGDRQPAFFLQAMPLISPESPWNVLSTPFEDVLRGDARRNRYRNYVDLASNVAARPTIDGLLGRGQREQPTWETEVHRTGYVSALYRDIQMLRVGEVDRPVVHSGTSDIFRAFCHMLKELLEISGTDVPYLVTSAYLNARGTCLGTESRWPRFSDPYEKRHILWPEHLRATGTDPLPIAESLCLEMFNAFGFKQIVK
jgi:hypothetical protein